MAERKAFLLRLNPAVHFAMERWAKDDLRSLNAQIEFALRLAMEKVGRKLGEEADAASSILESTKEKIP